MRPSDAKFLKRFGQRIRKLRRERGWSQEELAARCKLHRTYLGSVERGERNISVISLRRLARALRVSLSELFRGLQ